MNNNQVMSIVVEEIRENRKEIKKINKDLAELDKDFGKVLNKVEKKVDENRFKITLFIAGVSLLCTVGWAILLEKIKSLMA